MSRRFNRRPLSDAERDARRQADRERIEQAARALLTTDGWQRWIRVRATNGLSRYSLRNQWLIAIECHARGITPTYVAGFRAFLALNRCVRKGEKAIRILAPLAVKQRDDAGEETGEKRVFFRTVPVFDVAMTDPLPGMEPVPLAPPAEPIDGDSHRHLIAPLQAARPASSATASRSASSPTRGPAAGATPSAGRSSSPPDPPTARSARSPPGGGGVFEVSECVGVGAAVRVVLLLGRRWRVTSVGVGALVLRCRRGAEAVGRSGAAIARCARSGGGGACEACVAGPVAAGGAAPAVGGVVVEAE